jgi:hypothetical protein
MLLSDTGGNIPSADMDGGVIWTVGKGVEVGEEISGDPLGASGEAQDEREREIRNRMAISFFIILPFICSGTTGISYRVNPILSSII